MFQAKNKTLESWVSLEELCIDVSCGLVHYFLFSDQEEVLTGAVWFPKGTAPLLGLPVTPWKGGHPGGSIALGSLGPLSTDSYLQPCLFWAPR